MTDQANTPTVGPRPYMARERILLTVQAKWDTRNLPPLWYWRLLRPQDSGGTAPDEVLWQSPRVHRRYATPIPVRLYVDDSQKTKGQKKGPGVETNTTAKIALSRAEARRLGALLRTQDDQEGLVGSDLDDYLFLPRPGDIFRFVDDHFEVQQINPPQRYGPTGMPTVWSGTATLYRDDMTAPGHLLPEPAAPQPTQVPGG
jgi:hypothetical protein